MQMHQLQPKNKSLKSRRVGRGGKRGTFSGRGVKGQKSRSGAKIRPAIRDLIQQIPKLRGASSNTGARSASKNPMPIVTISLERVLLTFKKGETVTPAALYEKKLIRRVRGRIPRVKILGGGTIPKDIIISGCTLSSSIKTS